MTKSSLRIVKWVLVEGYEVMKQNDALGTEASNEGGVISSGVSRRRWAKRL